MDAGSKPAISKEESYMGDTITLNHALEEYCRIDSLVLMKTYELLKTLGRLPLEEASEGLQDFADVEG